MNAENYRRYLEAAGHRIIAGSSGYWSTVARSFYDSIPPYQVRAPDQEEVETLFRKHGAIGLKYCAPRDHAGKPSWFYVCEAQEYDLSTLHAKMRNKVRQGLRNCTVRQIDFDYLRDHGLLLNQDTLERQGRDDPQFSRPERWARLCHAGQQTEGASAWGAFVDGELAAYMITFIVDGYYNILHQMSRMDLLDTRANNALAYVATKEMLASPGIQGVSYGQASILELPGLQEYKFRLGYEKRPMRHVVALRPVLNTVLLSRLGDGLMTGLTRLFPDRDVIERISGTLDIARQSQDVGRSDDGVSELERGRGGAQERV
jgi:hypothetical protein